MLLVIQTAGIYSLGRFEKSMLSDQDRMDLFFTPEKPEEARRELSGDEADACSWTGISCDQGSVTHIDWHRSDLEAVGSINFEMLPPKLSMLNFYSQELAGDMNVSFLPETLTVFCVQSCLFTGSLDFSTLPRGLEQLFVTGNSIQSIANISNLPESLHVFQITETKLENDFVEVGKLPDTGLVVQLECSGVRAKVLNEADRNRVQDSDTDAD